MPIPPNDLICHPEAGGFCPPKDLSEPREVSRLLRHSNRAPGSPPYFFSGLIATSLKNTMSLSL
jgi:hypothetical protein